MSQVVGLVNKAGPASPCCPQPRVGTSRLLTDGDLQLLLCTVHLPCPNSQHSAAPCQQLPGGQLHEGMEAEMQVLSPEAPVPPIHLG